MAGGQSNVEMLPMQQDQDQESQIQSVAWWKIIISYPIPLALVWRLAGIHLIESRILFQIGYQGTLLGQSVRDSRRGRWRRHTTSNSWWEITRANHPHHKVEGIPRKTKFLKGKWGSAQIGLEGGRDPECLLPVNDRKIIQSSNISIQLQP